ncbi:MAG: YggT family protein [Ruminococcaceae bacterium]|nr:YggT family protein [Oscillospiraceae bacterium]
MGLLWGIISLTVSSVIRVLLLLFFIRAILSWVSPIPSSKIEIFIHEITDFIIDPIRRVLSRFEFVRSCPIDLSFSAAVLLLWIIDLLI